MTTTSKGTCKACHRPIQKSTHDKCMYCGEPLDETQRFSAEEKAEIQAGRERREEQWQEAQQRRIAELRKGSGSGDTGGWADIGDGGDCGGE